MRLAWGAFAACALLGSDAALASANSASTGQLSVRLLADVDSVAPSGMFRVGMFFDVKPGWHIYWRNPGSAGLPTSIAWQVPAGVSLGPILWPKPQKILEPGVVLYGYTGRVLLPMAVQTVATENPRGALKLIGKVSWTVCSDICVPGKAELSLTLPRGASSRMNAATAGLFTAALSAMPAALPASWHASAHMEREHFDLDVTTGEAGPPAQFYPYRNDVIDDASDQGFVGRRKGFTLTLVQSQFMNEAPAALDGLLMTDSGQAYALSVPISASGAAVSGDATPASAVGTTPAVPSSTKSASLGYALWLAFLGGVLLNIMPCVLPVLSLKIMHLAQLEPAELPKARAQAVLYLLGTLVSFWILAGTLAGLRLAGEQIGWGFQMQSPAVVTCLALLMFVLGLNLLGVFEIGGSWMGAGSSLAARSGGLGAFFTGVLAAVAATPCTAPFMGVAIGYALTQPLLAIALTFSALAIGLAAPFVLLSLWPHWLKLLPRPGLWMVKLRQALSFPMFLTAIWLVWVFARQYGADAAAILLVGLLLMALAVWILTSFARGYARNLLAAILGLGALAMPLSFARSLPAAATSESGKHGNAAEARLVWEAYTPQRLQQLRNEHRAVFVDFTAAWCVTCLVNERTILSTADVQRHLMESGAVLLKADWTSYSADITSALKDFGRVGIPFYVLYGHSEQPLLATEALTRERLASALNAIAADASWNPADATLDH